MKRVNLEFYNIEKLEITKLPKFKENKPDD